EPEAGVDLHEAIEASDEQPAADQQHQCNGDLQDDKRASHILTLQSAAGTTGRLLQCFVEILLACLPCRNETEDDACQERYCTGEEKDTPIEANLARARNG